MDPTQTLPIHGSSGNASIAFSKDSNPQIYFFLQSTHKEQWQPFAPS